MPSQLAKSGGPPTRKTLLPYSRQSVDDGDVQAVAQVLKSDWLTTGPKVEEFEQAFAAFVSAKEAVAVSSGTAALHAAMFAVGITESDEVIVPTMTFAATANAVVYQKGKPVFVDSNPTTLLIDPARVEEAITEKTKAIVATDYTGQPCDYIKLRSIAEAHHIALVADACHALGGSDAGQPVGSLADMSTFSFHPVKPMTTGEGGMITTDNPHFGGLMRQFRNHCITSDHRERHEQGKWFYEQTNLGYNYRLTDFQCALGISQLEKVPQWTQRRQEVAALYDAAFAKMDSVTPVAKRDNVLHAYHLYVVRLNPEVLSTDRGEIFQALRAEGIGVNVHFIPVHLHPFYQQNFGTQPGDCPNAELAYSQMLSLPVFAGMSNDDVADVIEAVEKVCDHYRKA